MREPSAPAARTILIVEDEEIVRGVMARALARHGFRVAEAATAEEALTLHALNPSIDLVVADVVLPGISGRNLAMMLMEQGLQAPVLFISGYDGEIEALDSLAVPDRSPLRKPFTPQALLDAVRQLLTAA